MICLILNCNNKRVYKKYCKTHYYRIKRFNDPHFVKYNRSKTGICSIKKCNNKHEAKGFCNKHYTRFRLHGDPNFLKYKHNVKCIIKNCKNKFFAKNMCKKHYNREYSKIYSNNNPKIIFKCRIKHYKKYGFYFNLDFKRYKWSLTSWGNLIKKRDNHECQICGSKENLNAHHILYKQYYPKLSLNENNGITLCKLCHKEIHILGNK